MYLNFNLSVSHEGVHEDNIVKAAEAFNKQFKIKHWMVHYRVILTYIEFGAHKRDC